MDIVQVLVSLASGIAGGNATGPALGDKNLGPIANTITGLLGGGLGSYALQALDLFAKSGALEALGNSGFDVGHFVANVASSGIGGAVLTAVVAYIKGAFAKQG